MNVDGVDIL